jgi:hypothetical protein
MRNRRYSCIERQLRFVILQSETADPLDQIKLYRLVKTTISHKNQPSNPYGPIVWEHVTKVTGDLARTGPKCHIIIG